MDIAKTVNILLSAIPVVGGVVSEVELLLSALRSTLAAHGYDADTTLLDARYAEDVRRKAMADDEAAE